MKQRNYPASPSNYMYLAQHDLLHLCKTYSVERGRCSCELERCECAIAPLSGLSYFHEGGTAANINADVNNCECDPDQCYNPQFPNVCTNSNSLYY